MIGCLPTQTLWQALTFLAVFVYATHATHATQAIAFEWKPGFTLLSSESVNTNRHTGQRYSQNLTMKHV